jgi:hypothetical protein
MKSLITCSGCKEEQNVKIQPFYDLSLDITPNNIMHVQAALARLQEKEIINGYACMRCSVNAYIKKLNTLIDKVSN